MSASQWSHYVTAKRGSLQQREHLRTFDSGPFPIAAGHEQSYNQCQNDLVADRGPGKRWPHRLSRLREQVHKVAAKTNQSESV